MEKQIIVLDLSKGFAYDFLYRPIIGNSPSPQYSFIIPFRPSFRSRKKSL